MKSIVELWIEELRNEKMARRVSGYGRETEPLRRSTKPEAYPETAPTQRTRRLFRALSREAGLRGLIVTLSERQYAWRRIAHRPQGPGR